VLAAFVMVALPVSVTLVSSTSDDPEPVELREGFAGWLDANAVEAQRLLTGVGEAMGRLEAVVTSGDAAELPAAQAAGRTAIADAQELWASAPPHQAGEAIAGALDAYLAATNGATVGEDPGGEGLSTQAGIDAAQQDMVEAIEQVQVVAAGAP
jgi:hypothetical protein